MWTLCLCAYFIFPLAIPSYAVRACKNVELNYHIYHIFIDLLHPIFHGVYLLIEWECLIQSDDIG